MSSLASGLHFFNVFLIISCRLVLVWTLKAFYFGGGSTMFRFEALKLTDCSFGFGCDLQNYFCFQFWCWFLCPKVNTSSYWFGIGFSDEVPAFVPVSIFKISLVLSRHFIHQNETLCILVCTFFRTSFAVIVWQWIWVLTVKLEATIPIVRQVILRNYLIIIWSFKIVNLGSYFLMSGFTSAVMQIFQRNQFQLPSTYKFCTEMIWS